MKPESRLLAYFRGLHLGRTRRRAPRRVSYSTAKAQLGFMVGFMRGRVDYRRAHPLGR